MRTMRTKRATTERSAVGRFRVGVLETFRGGWTVTEKAKEGMKSKPMFIVFARPKGKHPPASHLPPCPKVFPPFVLTFERRPLRSPLEFPELIDRLVVLLFPVKFTLEVLEVKFVGVRLWDQAWVVCVVKDVIARFRAGERGSLVGDPLFGRGGG